jgi:hypothetical protein
MSVDKEFFQDKMPDLVKMSSLFQTGTMIRKV